MKIIALILAAGRGTRAGSAIPKQWQNLGNRRIETDIFKTITMDYENFEFICRYLDS